MISILNSMNFTNYLFFSNFTNYKTHNDDDSLINYYYGFFPLITVLGVGVGLGFLLCKSLCKNNNRTKIIEMSIDKENDGFNDIDIEIEKNNIKDLETGNRKRIASRVSMRDLNQIYSMPEFKNYSKEKLNIEIMLDRKCGQNEFYKMKCFKCNKNIKGFSETFCYSDKRFCSEYCRDNYFDKLRIESEMKRRLTL